MLVLEELRVEKFDLILLGGGGVLGGSWMVG